MTVLCVAGALAAYLFVLAILAVRSGRFGRRFGDPVTRREHPVLFWWTVVVLVATGSGSLGITATALLGR